MLSHISLEELLDTLDFFEPIILIDYVLPHLSDANLLKVHNVVSFSKFPEEVQVKLRSHLMTRSLAVIQQLDNDGYFDRQQLYTLANAAQRKDIMEYALEQGYYIPNS
jgi:hypothetical protein